LWEGFDLDRVAGRVLDEERVLLAVGSDEAAGVQIGYGQRQMQRRHVRPLELMGTQSMPTSAPHTNPVNIVRAQVACSARAATRSRTLP
jgi:hypothetical protein